MTQLFQDTETGELWEFDDDVRVDSSQGYYEFMAPRGGRIDVPKTLTPAIRPVVPPALEHVPEVVSRYQGREAMRMTPYVVVGKPDNWTLFDEFEELLHHPRTPAYYLRAWDELQVFERNSAMLNDSAYVLGISQEHIDRLFRLASTLKA